ncbi:UPF0175 family protein [Rubrivirga sp.]|uniref:UPF0175 family protein n=1 Tax=Rubrivirga sp. TaxID=1885344 RepID=UPI003B51ABCE
MITLDLPPTIDEARARLLLAIALFQEEEVSVGKAAEIAGLSYRDFLDALRERGIPAYIYDDDEDWAREMETIRALETERRTDAA